MPSRRDNDRDSGRDRSARRRSRSRSKDRSRSRKDKETDESSRTRSRQSRSRDRDRDRDKVKSSQKVARPKDDDGLNRDFNPRDFHKVMYRRHDEGNKALCKRFEFTPALRHKDRRQSESVRPKVDTAFRQNYRVSRKVYDMYVERRWGATKKLLSDRFRQYAEVSGEGEPEREGDKTRDVDRGMEDSRRHAGPMGGQPQSWRSRERSPFGGAPAFAGRFTGRGLPPSRNNQRGRGVRSRLGPSPAVPYRPEEEANKPVLLLNDPALVPKHRAYFDHDEREGDRGGSDRGRRGRGRGWGDRGESSRRYRPPVAADGMWSHDMFSNEDELQSDAQ